MTNSPQTDEEIRDLILKYMEAYVADDNELASYYLKQIEKLKELCNDR